jgi:methionyl-tRNA formyltransferase
MRIVFMGTPDFAVPALVALVEAGHEVVAAYSQPPRPGGRRGKELTPSPVHKEAEARGIEVRHPVSLKGADEQAAFAALGADVAVVAAYGLILPQAVLDAPRHGCLNVHASLLPRWRGAAPIQRAILAGDEETGVCIMQMEAGLDTGPVRLCQKCQIGGAYAFQVEEWLSALGARLVIEVLSDLDAYPPAPQPLEGVTYARKIDKSETRLDFAKSAAELEQVVKAFAPSPGAWFEINGERVRVIGARWLDRENGKDQLPGVLVDQAWSCKLNPFQAAASAPSPTIAITGGLGYLQLGTVQPAGKQPMAADEFLRGRPHIVGMQVA